MRALGRAELPMIQEGAAAFRHQGTGGLPEVMDPIAAEMRAALAFARNQTEVVQPRYKTLLLGADKWGRITLQKVIRARDLDFCGAVRGDCGNYSRHPVRCAVRVFRRQDRRFF